MISVHSNMLAIGACRQFQINDRKTKKTTEKLSSGYRVNRAADDAAGLAISEKMRRQIRGLRQGTLNAQDGIGYAQVADGAMNEVHDILQRMNELTVKSLNGTCTESERTALNAEFDQLRTEIDRISRDTQYNGQPVFEAHEDSFYQIAGNKRWDDNQLHTVSSLENELKIHLPSSYYPDEYTLTVPAGVYTTQELMDEIDDALGRMSPPNPGFEFELTDKGYCKLNYERADGMPAEISSVDGSLSYLFYDFHSGNAPVNLLGTTVFDLKEPLIITYGKNDELGFYVEKLNKSNFISLRIPPGEYTRAQMIDIINDSLAQTSGTAGVTATEYGDSCIQIKGGDASINITGLKGNMFKLETSKPVYSSVFYDNVNYGSSSGGTCATVTGSSYYDYYTSKIEINDTNNILRFKLNGAADFAEIKLTNKEYSLSELAREINDRLKDEGLDHEAKASITNSRYLKLESTLGGSGSRLEFDITAGSVYASAYDALFLTTRYLPNDINGQNAQLVGRAILNGPITLSGSASLSFQIDNKTYTIDNLGGTYTDRNALITKLNDFIQNSVGFLGMKDKIKFISYGSGLAISALTRDIQKIDFDAANKNDTYKKLFTGTTTTINNGYYTYKYGSIERPQGSTKVDKIDAVATATIPSQMQSSTIKINENSNKIWFYTRQGNKSITLKTGNYNMAGLVTEINRQFADSGEVCLQCIKASYDSGTGKLTFTSTPPSSVSDGTWQLEITSVNNSDSAWAAILGTKTTPAEHWYQTARQASLTTYYAISENINIDGTNDKLTLNMGNGDVDLNIAQGSYNTRDALKTAVENAIKGSALDGVVTVEITNNGSLKLLADSNTLSASGSFYKEVILCKKTAASPQSYIKEGSYTDKDFEAAYIIGRKDLRAEPIEIFSGANDVFTFDFEYISGSADFSSYVNHMNVTIPEGVYNGDEFAAVREKKIQEKFVAEGLEDFDIKVSVGGLSTGVVGSNDDTALQIVVNRKADKAPAKGQYVLDGIRGSAASFVFYKTTGKPKETYIVGTKDISKGVGFKEGQNVLTFLADGVPYKYTFPEDTNYTGKEFIDTLNYMFANGDDNKNKAPLKASIENGALKIAHKAVGTHTITDIGGNARGVIFLEEAGRKSRDPMLILVGTETRDVVEMPRTRVSSCSLAINSLTLSKPKYADKALGRIKNAISMLSSRRSLYGTTQNRLEHTVNNNNNVIENTQASESVIRDADMAFEMMEQAKNNFMMQASQTILAQANQLSDMVLNLLQ